MLQLFAPPPDLADVVEAAVGLRCDAPRSTARFPALPRAMLTLQGPPHAPGTATSPQFHALTTRPTVHHADRPYAALGLVLHPAAAARLLGPVTGARVDVTLPWAVVAGDAEARRLDDALQQSHDDVARVRALLASVRRALTCGPERPRLARAESLQRLVTLVGRHGAQAAPLLGTSERQLERRCRAWLALSPKQLQRLVRFHGVLGHALRGRAPPRADDALAAGYYDQSHLAREARQLAGTPLQGLLDAAHEGAAWWPLATQRLQAAGLPG
ncbi:MAG: AraC family transcriptional regulator [Rubrivivax sp.]